MEGHGKRKVREKESPQKSANKTEFIRRIVLEFERPELREVIDGNYRIVYQVGGEDVLSLPVFESHRLFPLETEKE